MEKELALESQFDRTFRERLQRAFDQVRLSW